jgi:hypothetical protein
LRRLIGTICSTLLLALAIAAEDRSVKPPFRASLHADCALGNNPDSFWVTVDRLSATKTRIVFSARDAKVQTASFTTAGVLAGFAALRNDLVLTFENPGPTTRAYSEIDGKVKQTFECTSRFGGEALPISTTQGGALVCYQGEKMVGRLWVPTVAKIYLRGEKGFDLVAEVPYSRLFQTLAEISRRQAQKLSSVGDGANHP